MLIASHTPVAWSTIFIIDPVYTLPLVFGVLSALVLSRGSGRGHRISQVCLALSTAYLGWTILAKSWVDDTFTRALDEQGISYDSMFTTPTPFNSLLWRAAVMDDEGYYEAFYSVLDGDENIEFVHHGSEENLLDGLGDYWAVQRLRWFSKGFYTVDRIDDAVVMSDLRMGVESSYVFRFRVGRISNPHPVPVEPEELPVYRDMDKLNYMLRHRIWGRDG